MPYVKTPWVANVTPVTAASMNNIEAGIAGLSAPAPSTTPPATPADGDLWYLPAAAGSVWQFRYNAGSASAYKWEFVGGGPVVGSSGSMTLGTAGVWTDINLGPTFVLPRAGDYFAQAGCNVQSTAYASPYNIDFGIGGYAFATYIAATAFAGTYLSIPTPVVGAASGATLKLQGRIASAQNTAFTTPVLVVTPIRVS